LEVGIGAREKVLFGTFGVMNCLIHNIVIFFVWAMQSRMGEGLNKVDFVSTML